MLVEETCNVTLFNWKVAIKTKMETSPYLRCFIYCNIFTFFRPVRTLSPMENVTRLLDELLKNYKKEVRPGLGGEPLNIETDILVRSMGPVMESEMSYSMQCYLRQRWFDDRLKFSLENISEVTLSNSFLKNIWKPNTYFLNGRGSTQHNMTVPNVFVRIRDDGLIYMSRRITIKALCPMKLMDYPMDRPECPLKIGGYGYTTQDIIYLWKYGNEDSVDVYNDVTMSQFNMATIKARNLTEINHFGEFSVLEVYFYLQRHLGFFFLQTYLPCTLIVCLSWVSFWINRDAAPARVLLGVTTILSTAGICISQRDGLPRVSYATALDIYLNVCIVYNLAAMIEYAAVNYFTKVINKEGPKENDEEGKICDEEDMLLAPHTLVLPSQQTNGNAGVEYHTTKRKQDQCHRMFWRCFIGNTKYREQKCKTADIERGNSESKIDITSRYVFPASFAFFHIGYWAWFMRSRPYY